MVLFHHHQAVLSNSKIADFARISYWPLKQEKGMVKCKVRRKTLCIEDNMSYEFHSHIKKTRIYLRVLIAGAGFSTVLGTPL
jgi:hypothetical protein